MFGSKYLAFWKLWFFSQVRWLVAHHIFISSIFCNCVIQTLTFFSKGRMECPLPCVTNNTGNWMLCWQHLGFVSSASLSSGYSLFRYTSIQTNDSSRMWMRVSPILTVSFPCACVGSFTSVPSWKHGCVALTCGCTVQYVLTAVWTASIFSAFAEVCPH